MLTAILILINLQILFGDKMNRNTFGITGYIKHNFTNNYFQNKQPRRIPGNFSTLFIIESAFNGNKCATGQAKVNGICADIV